MSSTDLASYRTRGRSRLAPAQPYVAKCVTDWRVARSRWAALTERGHALPFQRLAWLDTWYRHCTGPGIQPLIVFVQDGASGRDVLGLALVRRRMSVTSVVTFADGGLSDYNAPAVAAGFFDTCDGAALLRTLRRDLPGDLIRFEKMPVTIDGRPNPLAALPGALPSSLIGNILHVPGTWDAWHRGLERTFRKELERASRVFERNPDAVFRRYEAGPEADRVYVELKRLQAARIAELKLPYTLGHEPARSFYDDIAAEGLRNGTAILTALSVGNEVVAALLGITDGTHYAMTRLATPGPQWKHFSPGRLLIERTLKTLHAEGLREFDFTIGDYPYKRRLGVTPVAMVDVTIALSPLGLWGVTRARLKASIKRGVARLVGMARTARRAKAETPKPV